MESSGNGAASRVGQAVTSRAQYETNGRKNETVHMVALAVGLARGRRLGNEVRREDFWRAYRDRVQESADTAERAGHLCGNLYRDPRFRECRRHFVRIAFRGVLRGVYERYSSDRTLRARGRASFEQGRLNLAFETGLGSGSREHLEGTYRLFAWGDIKCLIRPGTRLGSWTASGAVA